MIPGKNFAILFSAKTILFFTVAFAVAYFIFAHEGFYFDDDYAYAEMAGNLLRGNFSFKNFDPDLPAYHRFLIFGPVALFYKLFGVNIYAVSLWPFLCTIGSLGLIYIFFRKEDNWLTIFALLLLGLNFHTLFLEIYLFPDNILMFFAFAAAGILYVARRQNAKPKIYAFLFVLANFGALLSKETIAWYLPFYLLVAFTDFFQKKHTVFWRWSLGVGLVVLFLYLLSYKLSFGSFFYRFTMVENTNLVMTDNFVNDASKNVWPRITFAPLLFFIGSGIFLPLAFCLRYFRERTFKQFFDLNKGESFWFWLAILVLLQFWFGSTSINFYNPITLIPRMATPLFPPLCLAAAYQLRNFFRDNSGAFWFAIPLLLAAIYARSAMSLVYGLPGLYFALAAVKSGKFAALFKAGSFLLILILAMALRPLHFMRKPTVSSFFDQEEIIRDHFSKPAKQSVLFVDGWLETSAAYYFNFDKHEKVVIKNYDDYSPEILKKYQQAFVLINANTLTNPDLQYNPPKPRFTFTEDQILNRFQNRKLLAEKGLVKLYEIPVEANSLKQK